MSQPTGSLEQYSQRYQHREKAEDYATRFARGSLRRIDRNEHTAVRRIFDAWPDCRTVLDVPCGAGRFRDALAAPQREYVGVDISAELIRIARERCDGNGLGGTFLVGNACDLPMDADSIDCIFCNRLLHHILSVPERAQVLSELHRVTRRHLVLSYFEVHCLGRLRRFLKSLKGRVTHFENQPTLPAFLRELEERGFRLQRIVPTGPFWVAQKFLVLEAVPQGSTKR